MWTVIPWFYRHGTSTGNRAKYGLDRTNEMPHRVNAMGTNVCSSRLTASHNEWAIRCGVAGQ
jgi:hypothetical protein